MLTNHASAQLKYPQLTKPKLVLTNADSYPEQNWSYQYTHAKTISKLIPLLKAAYPDAAHTYTNTAELALHWAGKAEVTQWLINFAQHLGLIHFGRFKTAEGADLFRLEFNQPQKRNCHLQKLGWQLSKNAWSEDNTLDVVIKTASVNYFIDQFWSNEIDNKLTAHARKNGLTLADMQRLLNQQEWELKLILGGERNTFDLIVATLHNS